MKKFVCLFLSFFLWCGQGFAGQASVISLSDGNTLYGEVVSFKNGVYVIRTESLGTISIPQSRISAIRQDQDPGPSGSGNQDVLKLQRKMMGDEEVMALIFSLQNDPEFQAALGDPSIMKAVAAGDVPALMNNPKFTRLLQNAKVKQIQNKTLK